MTGIGGNCPARNPARVRAGVRDGDWAVFGQYDENGCCPIYGQHDEIHAVRPLMA